MSVLFEIEVNIFHKVKETLSRQKELGLGLGLDYWL